MIRRNFLFLMKRRYFLTKGFRFCLEMWTIYTDSVDFYLPDICVCFRIHRDILQTSETSDVCVH
jgi:hypothetical protein